MSEPVKSPVVVMTDIVFPEDTNQFGTMFGGRVMAIMDKAAFLAAVRFARTGFVTISSDGIRFLTPIVSGDMIETRARVAFVGRTSVVVKVEVYRDRLHERAGSAVLATQGWFAMASRDSEGRGVELPPLLIETDTERTDAEHGREFRERSRTWV